MKMEIEITQEFLDNVKTLIYSQTFVDCLINQKTDITEVVFILQTLRDKINELQEKLNED